MREIKFRAWLKGVFNEGGDMVYFDLFSTDGNYIIKEGRSVREGDAVMQYTGLKDKNGVEIYEGDIVRDYGGFEGEVFWDKYMFNVSGYYNTSFDYPCDAFSEGAFEIIGNIYEQEGSQC